MQREFAQLVDDVKQSARERKLREKLGTKAAAGARALPAQMAGVSLAAPTDIASVERKRQEAEQKLTFQARKVPPAPPLAAAAASSPALPVTASTNVACMSLLRLFDVLSVVSTLEQRLAQPLTQPALVRYTRAYLCVLISSAAKQ